MRRSIVLPTFTTEFTGGIRGYYLETISREVPTRSAPALPEVIAALDLQPCVRRTGAKRGESGRGQNLEQRVLGAEG